MQKYYSTKHCVKRVIRYMVSFMFTCICTQRDVGVNVASYSRIRIDVWIYLQQFLLPRLCLKNVAIRT